MTMLTARGPALICRGSTIFVALIFILIVAVSVGAMLEFTISEQRLTRRRIERESVYYTAEAGIDQVVHYLMEPTHFTANTSLFTVDSSTQTFRDSSAISVFESRLSGSGTALIDVDNNVNPNLIVFTNEPINTGERARVTNLTVYPPSWDAGAPAGTVLIVESTAENEFAVSRTVRSWITADPTFPDLDFPAAVVSHAAAGANGQMNVHWGEAWIQSDLDISNLSNITTTADPFAVFRVGGYIMKGTKYAVGSGNGWDTSPLVSTDPNYEQPWLGYDSTRENLWQHVDFDADVFSGYDDIDGWDDLALVYEQWRLLALDRGHFFSTDSSGNLYYGTEETAANRINSTDFFSIIDQTSELTVDTMVPGSQTLPPPSIVFIDTIDGNPPAADGSNFCDIQLAGGGGIFTRGVFYIAGNLRVGGVGTPPPLWIQDPLHVQTDGASGTEHIENVRHMGIIYADGLYEQQGNQITYGCIAARNGFGTGGTPDVWYDERLKNGIPFPFDPGITVARWAEVSGPMIN